MRGMKKKIPNIALSSIPEKERTATVQLLLSVIEMLQEQLAVQSLKMDALIEEIRGLKKLNTKPNIKPSKLPKKPKDDDDSPSSPNNSGESTNKRAGSTKRSKNKALKIDKEKIITAENIPIGAIRKGYREFIVQDLEIKTITTKYLLERWKLPSGEYHTAKLPNYLDDQHFGAVLRSYIIYQYHHQGVTQPLLYAQLREWDIDISKGQLNRILIEEKEDFHQEKSSILKAGLSVSKYVHTDDTGARHKGINGYCTHIGNELFAWFESRKNKSRINFLEILQLDNRGYFLTEQSFAYMKRYKVAPWLRDRLKDFSERKISFNEWDEVISDLKIKSKVYIRIITEAALIGNLIVNGLADDIIILSDDAGQFNVFQHALCWIHAERGIASLIPINKKQTAIIEWARQQIWDIYHLLIEYKKKPNKEAELMITQRFEDFCHAKIDYYTLKVVLNRLYANKDELLMVLKHPEIPLHNNLSERDIREYVKRRKISGSTRSDDGRKCRDTFASLKKTAKKLGIKFWDYLVDRISLRNNLLPLPALIKQAVA